jgi:cob(I)alamin adenosyltransferase
MGAKMKIYTKGGDQGETGLLGGVRVPKDDLRIRTYGTLDELNAVFGLILADSHLPLQVRTRLLRIQGELFQLGAELATPRSKKSGAVVLEITHVQSLENEIDEMELTLSPLQTFILPGGSLASSQIHLARTVSRRAEREMVTLNRAEPLRLVALQYLNRLSDYLFVTARFVNHLQGGVDTPWISP